MNYIFYLPNYVSYSNGIKSLWYTAYLFSKYREASIISFYAGEIGTHELPDIYKKLKRREVTVGENDVVIYPDMVEGNPLHAKNVARYLMAKPYILNGKGISKECGDFLFAFSRAVDVNLPQLNTLLPEFEELAKYKKGKKEKTLVIYYGKCRVALGETNIKEIIKDFNEIKIITRIIPSAKEDLYEEISSAALFVSFDPLSSLAHEANLVGTPSLLLDPVFKDYFDNFNHNLPGFYYDYEKLKKEDLVALGSYIFEKSHAELMSVLAANEIQVRSIIEKIENHFGEDIKVNSRVEDDAIQFYNEKWKASPIVNCTTIPSVIAYNLLRKNVLIFIISQLLYRIFNQLRRFNILDIKKYAVQLFFTRHEIDLISYKWHPERKKINKSIFENSKKSVFRLDGGFFSFVWRMVCR